MEKYLTTLLTEKGITINSDMKGLNNLQYGEVINFTWQDLINLIQSQPDTHDKIRAAITRIDLVNGDVLLYLTHIANQLINS